MEKFDNTSEYIIGEVVNCDDIKPTQGNKLVSFIILSIIAVIGTFTVLIGIKTLIYSESHFGILECIFGIISILTSFLAIGIINDTNINNQ